jgi:hypothetical protein
MTSDAWLVVRRPDFEVLRLGGFVNEDGEATGIHPALGGEVADPLEEGGLRGDAGALEVRYNDVSADLGNEFRFERDFNEIHCGARNVEIARRLNPRLQTFDEWLAQNKSRIPLE